MNRNDSLIVVSKGANTMREALGVSLEREILISQSLFTKPQPSNHESLAQVAARISREMDLNPAELFIMGMMVGAAISDIKKG